VTDFDPEQCHMIGKLLDLLFGCHHRLITRPITPVLKHSSQPNCTYVVCLECGKQFHYDTRNMRVGPQIPMSLSGPS
jgi:hypothetical protein